MIDCEHSKDCDLHQDVEDVKTRLAEQERKLDALGQGMTNLSARLEQLNQTLQRMTDRISELLHVWERVQGFTYVATAANSVMWFCVKFGAGIVIIWTLIRTGKWISP
jgi:uncharacterized coiled-coil protein SlyX